MQKVIILNKKEGETPLETLESFRAGHKEYKNVPMTYAGRLDPMASGILVVLAGEECKNKDKYLKLNKEYEFEVLFGFSTDTYDILGKVTENFSALKFRNAGEMEKLIKENLKYFRGKFIQKYPIYSSKTVKGKQLFEYAREGVDLPAQAGAPAHEVEVKSLKFIKIKTISGNMLLKSIERRVGKVRGDFRQREILKIWRKELKNSKEKYFVASFHIKCGSGTYVRSIANELGEKLGVPSLALTISRTKVGKWGKVR